MADQDRGQQSPSRNIVETALTAGMQLSPKVIASPLQDGVPFVVLRDADGKERMEDLHARFACPARKKGSIVLNDADSFVAVWKKHNAPNSSIYAKLKPATFLAVFDDHGTTEPAYREFRASYTIAHSKEYESWNGRNKQKFEGNEAFALWIEDQLPDFVKPEGAKMMEIALNMRVNQGAAFGNAVRLADGDTELSYTNNVEASARVGTGKVKIPEEFEISIPVFDGLDAKSYAFKARFRYRLAGSTLSLWYELIRPHKVIEQAFADLLQKIEKETKAKALFGSPE